MKRYNRKGAYHIRVFNIEPSGVMTLVAKSKQELSKKAENRIFKKKGYELQDQHETELKAKDEEIKNLKAMAQNMCAECACAKFADNAIKPSEMWKLHTMLKGNK